MSGKTSSAEAIRGQNGQARKAARIESQHQRETANRALSKSGKMTPWETACAQRAGRRKDMKKNGSSGSNRSHPGDPGK